jgi:hypothetical protein
MSHDLERYPGERRHQAGLARRTQEPPVCVTAQVESAPREVIRYVDRPVEPAVRARGTRTLTYTVEVPEGCGCLEYANERLAMERHNAYSAPLVADLAHDAETRQIYRAGARASERGITEWTQIRNDVLRYGCHNFTPGCPGYAENWSQ